MDQGVQEGCWEPIGAFAVDGLEAIWCSIREPGVGRDEESKLKLERAEGKGWL